MKRIGSLLVLVPLLAFASGTDGVWTLREHYCIKLDRKAQCGRGSEQYMFVGETAYYRGDPSEQWIEAGTARMDGRRIRVALDKAGFDALVASRTGIDVSDYVQSFSLSYSGKLQGSRIVNGHLRADALLEVAAQRHTLRARGSFGARRVGDPEPIPSPEEPSAFRPGVTGSVSGVTSLIAHAAAARLAR
jgi:hypothetical protein